MLVVLLDEGPRRELRIDPHAAGDRGYRRFAVHGFDGDTRGVLVAEPAG